MRAMPLKNSEDTHGEDRTFGRNLGTYGQLDMWDGLSNLMKEFWPDVHRKMQHKHNTPVADSAKP